MKDYKINPELKKYILEELQASYHSCHFLKKDGVLYCRTNCGSDAFHRIVQRARCVKKTKETGELYLTLWEALNSDVARRLMARYNRHSYSIIDDPDGSRLLDFR